MEQKINELTVWLKEENAVIGHIKGSVSELGKTSLFSNTGAATNITENTAKNAVCSFAAIVLCMDETKLKDKVAELFSDL